MDGIKVRIFDIEKITLVISKIPKNNGSANAFSMPQKSKIKEIKFIIGIINLLCCKMEIITENITTNPPIDKIVEILFAIDELKISPKFESCIIDPLFLLMKLLLILSCFLCQNLKIKPTVKHPKI